MLPNILNLFKHNLKLKVSGYEISFANTVSFLDENVDFLNENLPNSLILHLSFGILTEIVTVIIW